MVGIPPTVISVPETKEIEVGTYSDFKADMAAILITDDNQEKLPYATKMPVSVKIGDNVSENADGFSEFLFDKVGEYTVKVEIKDVDGNVAYTEYKIKTVDTTAPEIVVGNLVYVWADNGSVVLPSPKVVDFSACTTQVAVKKDGVELTEVRF